MYHIKCQQFCKTARSLCLFLSLFVYMHLCHYHDSSYVFYSNNIKLKELFLWVGCCHFSVTVVPLNTLTHKVMCTHTIQQTWTRIQ